MKPAKTILTVHDLSSVGRCALTVAIPALAAAGCQPIPLPTAVLSAHTGFSGVAVQRLDGFMDACRERFPQAPFVLLDVHFRCQADTPRDGPAPRTSLV